MKALFNPFHRIAGVKALIFGMIFIVASALMLYSGGMIQDSYIHIGMAEAPFLEVLGAQTIWWIVPTMLLYLCGLLLSGSKVSVIDLLGTTAFAQLIMLMMIAPMLLPAVSQGAAIMSAAVQQGVEPSLSAMLPVTLYGLWTIVTLVLFYIWNYNGFAVSCKVSGWKAILLFIMVQVVCTIVGVKIH